MKTLLLLVTAAGLSGCVVYPAQPYDPYYGAASAPYVAGPPLYFYGGLYWFDAPGVFYPNGYGRVRPGAFGSRPPQGLGVPGRQPGNLHRR